MTTTEEALVEGGDSVFHGPTKETWYLLGVNKRRNEVCAGGWPATIGKLSDCTLTKKGLGITALEMAYRIRAFGHGWDSVRIKERE